ncbi:MAG: right-handed parallel beta-helix repeat-containing protein [Phycisphaeraceae bacterium]
MPMTRFPGALLLSLLAIVALAACAATPESPSPRASAPTSPGPWMQQHEGGFPHEINPVAGGPQRVTTDSEPAALKSFSPGRHTHLKFLHTFEPGPALEDHRLDIANAHRVLELPPEPPTVLRYQVTYEDGETITIPVRFGESIHQWYRVHGVGPMLWARPLIEKNLHPTSGEKGVVYTMTWPNPRPDVAMTKVEALPSDQPGNWGEALLFGVTAGNDDASDGRFLYVARKPLGSDDNPGTFDAPFGSLQKAADEVQPGDTVFIRKGYYPLDEPVTITTPGEEDKWITFTAYPGETPIFDGFGVFPHVPERDFDLPHYHFERDRGAIHALGADYLAIRGLQVQNSRRAGISAYGRTKEDRVRFVDVSHNRVSRAMSMGIITHAIDELTILGNTIARPHSTQMDFAGDTLEPVTRSKLPQEAIDLNMNTGFEIAWNQVYGGSKEAIDLISTQQGSVHHNYVHSSLNGIYIDSWELPITDLDIHHNFIHNAFTGIPLATEGGGALARIDIHHNIVINSKTSGLAVSEATYKAEPAPVHDIRLFQNTVDRSGYHAEAIGWHSTGIEVHGFKGNERFRGVDVFNNIVTASAQTPIASTLPMQKHDIRISHNLVHPAENRTSAALGEKQGEDATAMDLGEALVTEAPDYVAPGRGDYRLAEGSPAIDAGNDWAGDSQDASPDLGALPRGSAWAPGFDFAGHVTAFYRGELRWEPVHVRRDKYTLHRNHLQRPSWFQVTRYGADFDLLGSGERAMGGIIWSIKPSDHSSEPTVMALRGHGGELDNAEIADIKVGKQTDSLAFLHVYHPGPALKDAEAGTQLFRYVVHYADGSEAVIPVRWQQDVGDWLATGEPEGLPKARLAWHRPYVVKPNQTPRYVRLLAMQWDNPRPGVAIDSIDIVTDAPHNYGAPAVFAISTGHRD